MSPLDLECSPPMSCWFCLFASQKFELLNWLSGGLLATFFSLIGLMRWESFAWLGVCLISRWAHIPAVKPRTWLPCLRRRHSLRFHSLHPSHRSVCRCTWANGWHVDQSLCVDANTINVYDRDAQAWLCSAPEEWRKVTSGGMAKKAVLLFHWLLMVHGVPYWSS